MNQIHNLKFRKLRAEEIRRSIFVGVVWLLVMTSLFYAFRIRPILIGKHLVTEVYEHLMVGNYDGVAEVVEPRALQEFRELEEEYGKVREFRIIDANVQILGTPWYVDVAVVRDAEGVEGIGGEGSDINGVFRTMAKEAN